MRIDLESKYIEMGKCVAKEVAMLELHGSRIHHPPIENYSRKWTSFHTMISIRSESEKGTSCLPLFWMPFYQPKLLKEIISSATAAAPPAFHLSFIKQFQPPHLSPLNSSDKN